MSSTGGDGTRKQRWVLFPSGLKKVLLPHPLWYLPITITGAWHRSLFFHTACFYFSVKHRFCFTTLLPHRTATSTHTERRLGVALPTPSPLHQQVISFSLWLPLDVSLLPVKAHVIPRQKGQAEARNPQADRHGETSRRVPGGAGGCPGTRYLARGDGLRVGQETPARRHLATVCWQSQAGERDEQILVKKMFSVVSLPQGCLYHESSQICWFDSRLRAGCALHAWKAQRNTDIRLIT